MTTLEMIKQYFIDAKLTDDFTLQDYLWVEDLDSDYSAYMVFQPKGGSGRLDDLGGDDYFTISLISGKNWVEFIVQRAYQILEYVRVNSQAHCLNFIINTSGFVNPIPTEEGRFVIPLSFRCTS